MSDRELLELAAKAAGLKIYKPRQEERDKLIDPSTASLWLTSGCTGWNPLVDDNYALRLANKLSIDILHNWESVTAQWELGKFCREKCTDETRNVATRRAITRAAAEIGKAML